MKHHRRDNDHSQQPAKFARTSPKPGTANVHPRCSNKPYPTVGDNDSGTLVKFLTTCGLTPIDAADKGINELGIILYHRRSNPFRAHHHSYHVNIHPAGSRSFNIPLYADPNNPDSVPPEVEEYFASLTNRGRAPTRNPVVPEDVLNATAQAAAQAAAAQATQAVLAQFAAAQAAAAAPAAPFAIAPAAPAAHAAAAAPFAIAPAAAAEPAAAAVPFGIAPAAAAAFTIVPAAAPPGDAAHADAAAAELADAVGLLGDEEPMQQ